MKSGEIECLYSQYLAIKIVKKLAIFNEYKNEELGEYQLEIAYQNGRKQINGCQKTSLRMYIKKKLFHMGIMQ